MSTLAINTLTGQTSASSITVRGEGSATTNLQQGLKKVWINLNGGGTIATRDSFNVTSITDDATGRYTVTIANDMSSGNYSCIAGGCVNETTANNTQARQGPGVNNFATGSIQTHCGSNTYSANDWDIVTAEISGDLA